MKSVYIICFLILFLSATVFAKGGGGGHALGANIGFLSPSQDDMNTLISRANTREGGITTAQLNSAYEFSGDYVYRFSGTMFAFMFRPAFFYQKQSGSGASGSFNYSLMGYSLFPMFRLYPLENSFIRFFMQVGLGYGSLSGDITEGGAQLSFSGDAFGFQGGIGAEFCFTANHCMNVEGNTRYMPVKRNIAKSVGGSFAADSLSQAENAKEVEVNDSDLMTTMSGIQGILGYIYYF